MRGIHRFLFSVFVVFFISASVFVGYSVFLFPSSVSAAVFRSFSLEWNYPAYGSASAPISQHALDSIDDVVYFGSSVVDAPYDFLYAVNITNGQLIWTYNTMVPVNYVSHFNLSNSRYVIAGTGGSTTAPTKNYILARSSQDNATLWTSPDFGSSVTCVGPIDSNVTGTNDVVAGLKNGTIIRLSGNNGTIQWQYNAAGVVDDIVQLNNGRIVVGTSDFGAPKEGHIYCLNKNGTRAWFYDSTSNNPLTPGLVKEFGDVNNDGVPDVIAVFHNDNYIHVFNGATGSEIGTPWFDVGNPVSDLLCTQDYTGDGFPDIVAGTVNGSLMKINGRTATLILPLTSLNPYIVTYIQYMYSYENGTPYYLNKTLAVGLVNSSSSYTPLICGVNASDLAVIGQISVPSSATARNLLSVANYTSTYTGDLLFTANNMVYLLSGADIIVPEFPSQIILIVFIVAVWFLVAILRREHLRMN
jgi:hypothetical protein